MTRHLHSADASRSSPDGHRSTTKAIDTDRCRLCRDMPKRFGYAPRASIQRSAGASSLDDSAHRGEWGRHSGRRPVRAEMRMAHCAAISSAVRIEDAHTPARNHDRSHKAFCQGATSEGDSDCTISRKVPAHSGMPAD